MARAKQDRPLLAMVGTLVGILPGRRRWQLSGLGLLLIIGAFAEIATLGAIIPFVGMLIEPGLAFRNPVLAGGARLMGVETPQDMLLPVTVAFCAAALIAGVIRILVARLNASMAYGIGADLGLQVFRRTLHQPYSVHLERNSSEVVSGITRKIDGVVRGVILALLNMASSGLLFLVALGVLLLINPLITSMTAVIFGGFYGSLTVLMRQRLKRYGKTIATSEGGVFKTLNEGLGGIREVKLYGQQEHYTRLYKSFDLPLRRAQADSVFTSQFPRFALEAIAIVLIALTAFLLVEQSAAPFGALPTLAALALGGQRMLPALQQVYAGWSALTHSKQILADVTELLETQLEGEEALRSQAVKFERQLELEDCSFEYPASSVPVLCNVTMKIAKGSRIGIVGPTGSGKSTLVDLIIGLQKPSSGKVLVDEIQLGSEVMRSWQDKIAQVPQAIHIIDGTFAENIAIGKTDGTINSDRVRAAARRARIEDTILAREAAFEEIVGEDGLRLSGGQRQRLGIARALYREPQLLVFDEATSALDSQTEREVIETLDELARDLTIIMIAHRTSTLEGCDQIYEFDKGRLVWRGDYAEFSQRLDRQS